MHRRIVILGFMGSGKTTVGGALARALNCDFVDLDSYINKQEGRSPAEIIKEDGEASFREVETLALRSVLERPDARVIALGGGTWTKRANRTLVALHDCHSVWLDAPFELCWKRIEANPEIVRPMATDRVTGEARFETRRQDYASAQRHIAVDESDTAETIAEKILREL